jgi:hypothetical protein
MDCEACGRYRPSPEIAPLRVANGRLLMACSRCRRLATGRREPAWPAAGPTAMGAADLALTY